MFQKLNSKKLTHPREGGTMGATIEEQRESTKRNFKLSYIQNNISRRFGTTKHRNPIPFKNKICPPHHTNFLLSVRIEILFERNIIKKTVS